ncbi:MAG: TlpA disulfide reductase family protein [Rikenellaceae bacterium]
MKKLLFTLSTALVVCSCGTGEKPTISGTLTGTYNDTIIFNTIDLTTGAKSADTIALDNGKFEFYALDNSSVKLGYLQAKPSSVKNSDGSIATYSMRAISFPIAPDEHVVLEGTFEEYTMSGSNLYKKIAEYQTSVDPLVAEQSEINRKLRALNAESDPQEREDLQASLQEVNKNLNSKTVEYITNNPNEGASLYITARVDTYELKELLPLFTEELKSGVYGNLYNEVERRYKNQVAKDEAIARVQPGQVAPDFTLLDVNGKEISLSSLRGKYVVIDFWGSWCGWCIKGFPEMKKMYSKYKNKLEILGVACRDTQEAWEGALKEQKLPWKNVINSTEEGEDISVIYSVSGFPTKVIIDPKGVIVETVLGERPEFYTTIDSLMK